MRVIIFYFFLITVSSGFAEILGVSTKTQLLQQLSLSLKISVTEMSLPATVLDKLPNSGLVDEIKPSFLTAWTQVTFLGCARAIALGKIKITSHQPEALAWIQSLASGAWGKEPTAAEVEEIYLSSFNGNGKKEQTHSLACSMVMSSPHVYLKKY